MKAKYKIGEYVRISYARGIYKINDVQLNIDRFVYKLLDTDPTFKDYIFQDESSLLSFTKEQLHKEVRTTLNYCKILLKVLNSKSWRGK